MGDILTFPHGKVIYKQKPSSHYKNIISVNNISLVNEVKQEEDGLFTARISIPNLEDQDIGMLYVMKMFEAISESIKGKKKKKQIKKIKKSKNKKSKKK